MSKKDYEMIARVLAGMRNPLLEYDLSTLDWVAKNLGFVFLADNPKFDMEKFKEACNVDLKFPLD